MALPEVVSLSQAKQHVRITHSDEDSDLQIKLDIAHELVGSYIDQLLDDDEAETWSATIANWSYETAPARVKGAVLEQFAELWRFRGDDSDRPKAEPGRLSPNIERLLIRFRDPAVA